jgi:hypothetical protein
MPYSTSIAKVLIFIDQALGEFNEDASEHLAMPPSSHTAPRRRHFDAGTNACAFSL